MVADAADENFVIHATWPLLGLPGARVERTPGLLIADSGLPCDTFNVVCRARLEDAAEPAIEAAIAHFATVRRPFSWWVGPGDRPARLGAMLAAAGLEASESELAMAADLRTLTAGVAPASFEIRRVRSPAELSAFARINAANWSPPDPYVLQVYARAAPVLLAPDSPQWFYVGYCDGEAVAAAELTLGGGVAGLYGISTLEAFRRRGFGSAMTRRPLLDARDRGVATAILQASGDGAGIYRRVGFREFGTITEYKPQPN